MFRNKSYFTPLPVGIVLSALRSAGSDASFASIEESFTDFQSKLGSSAGGSAPQPRSIDSIDPRDADRLVERDVVDTSRDQGLSDFVPTWKLSIKRITNLVCIIEKQQRIDP